MNTSSTAHPLLNLGTVAAPTKAEASETVLSQEEVYARAELRMRRGKRLVISGFVVTVVGIVAYCIVCFAAGGNPELGAHLLENPGQLVGPTLATIGMGTLIWLVGSVLYVSGGMDSDPDGPDLYF